MTETTPPISNLIRAIIETLRGDEEVKETWQSMSIIISSFEGRFNSASGYVYSPDGTITAVAAHPRIVIPFVYEYIESVYNPGDAHPISFLIQFDRVSKKYTVTFEDTDESRWKITPATFRELQQTLRPNLGSNEA